MYAKQDLPVQEIKHMLDEGLRQTDVAEIFNVSQTTISRIAKMPEQSTKSKKSSTRTCSCCGLRPIATGNRFLCSVCYQAETVEEHTLCA